MSEKKGSSSNKLEEEVELRRGPWTLEEDTLLIHYIACHGEGRWNLLARCSGLKRTGKSCRLRWLNYLNPDIKRGNLSPEEQLLILELHSKWGNRWSRIAQHLPGRTDNEIKNYWRTRVQKQARQLKIDANSAVFRDVVRCYWLPRLLEPMGSPAAVQSLLSSSTTHHCTEHTANSTMSPAATAPTDHDQAPCHQGPVSVHDYPLGHHHPSMECDRLMENCSISYNFSPCTSSAAAAAPSVVPQVTDTCELSSRPHDHELNSVAFSSYDNGGYPVVDNAYFLGSWENMAPASAPSVTLSYDSTFDYTTSASNNCTITTTNASTGNGSLWSMDELYGMLKSYMNGVEYAASLW